jgi:hypothetical protein
MQRDKAMTDRAADIDAKIEAARAALAKVDIKEAIKEADPQAAALALLGGRFIGEDKHRIRTLIHAILAIVLEAGSGFGLYLIFGSHAVRRHERHQSAPNSDQRPTLIPASDHDKELTIEKPAHTIERFFRECVRLALGERVSASVMNVAYEQWCAASERDPVSPNMFGRRAPWRKDRIGGRVWYLDARLCEEFTNVVPTLPIAANTSRTRLKLGGPGRSPGSRISAPDCPGIAPDATEAVQPNSKMTEIIGAG